MIVRITVTPIPPYRLSNLKLKTQTKIPPKSGVRHKSVFLHHANANGERECASARRKS